MVDAGTSDGGVCERVSVSSFALWRIAAVLLRETCRVSSVGGFTGVSVSFGDMGFIGVLGVHDGRQQVVLWTSTGR